MSREEFEKETVIICKGGTRSGKTEQYKFSTARDITKDAIIIEPLLLPTPPDEAKRGRG